MIKPTVCFLADDDKDDQEIFEIALQQSNAGAKLFTADDGHNALQYFNQHPQFVPDYIFLDLNMPRLNGLQCLEKLKQIDRLKNTPAFIYTTSSADLYKQQALKLGAEGFVTKPSHIDDLATILEGIFNKN